HLKDTVMDSLLLQGANQLSILLKNLCTVTFLAFGGLGYYRVDLSLVVQVELATFCLALTVVIVALVMVRARDLRTAPTMSDDWKEPSRAQLVAVARHNYATSLVQTVAAPNIFVLGIERF